MVLPHELVPWLIRHGAFPAVTSDDLKRYWGHCRDRVPFGRMGGEQVHPFFLWGDDCQYNKNQDKIIVIILGHVLDERTYSMETSWPLVCIREAPWLV